MWNLLPLVFAVVICLPVLFVPLSSRARVFVSRLALPIFGTYVANESPRRTDQRMRMRAAHVPDTHRAYASRTLFISGVMGVAGSIFGVYLVALLLDALAISPATLREQLPAALSFLAGLARLSELSLLQLFALLLFASATAGTLLAVGTYWFLWFRLDQRAQVRSSEIEASLPRMVAFVYALSRSGMPFPRVLETLAENRGIYGEAASEMTVVVRDMDTFGTDVITALQEMATRTPSEGLEEFTENLASVLGSGRNLSSFLHEQYERFQEEAEAQQEQYLELLSTFAEAYVTVLVAGPLFFITVLVVIGLVLQDTLPLLRVISYLGIPLASFGFIVYIDSITESLRGPGWTDVSGRRTADPRTVGLPQVDVDRPGSAAARFDGGSVERVNLERLRAYDLLDPFREWLEDPLGSVVDHPLASLLVTVPVALVWMVVRVGSLALTPTGVARALDEPLIEGLILVFGVLAFLYEIQDRRLRAIETATPDFLDRLASVNEAGVSIVESIRRVSRTDLGELSEAVHHTWRDIQWGADVEAALYRLDARVETPMVSRAVALVANAMRASGDLAPVLRIAADEAQNTRRLRRERRQTMLTYLIVIYVSFFVFLGIIAALTVAFIPAVESASAGADVGGQVSTTAAGGGLFTGIQDVNTDAYELLFFHVAAIQGICSGLIAGQLGEGSVYDGLKHATILLLFSYVLFSVI